MKLKRMLWMAFMLCFLYSLNAKTERKADLDALLFQLGEYCERIKNDSIKYYCHEHIYESVWARAKSVFNSVSPRVYRNKYLYDYQVVLSKKEKTEQRILLRHNGKRYKKPIKFLPTRVPHKLVIMGPYGIFGKAWQGKFRYEILKSKMQKGEKVFIIEATPVNNETVNHLWGKAWVRARDGAILKIQWDQAGMDGFRKWKKKLRRLALRPIYKLSSEYGFEYNGIRFPTKYKMTETYLRYGQRGQNDTLRKSSLLITYSNYKFFSVDTQDHKILNNDIGE